MKRAVGYGSVLLAASIAATGSALAWSGGPQSAAGSQFFMSGPGAATTHGAQGYFGVDFRDVTADQVGALKLKDARGAEIVLVDHDAPAGKAGLREHDVVLQMNGHTIDGKDQLSRMLHESPPGRTIVLVISRDGQQITVTSQMSTHEEVDREVWEQHLAVAQPQDPSPDSADSGSAPDTSSVPSVRAGNSFIGTLLMSPSYTGATLETMSTQLADYFGVTGGAGLLVRSVQPNSPAALAGMHAGDVVMRANSHSVVSTGDWTKAIKNSHGQPLTIVVMRDRKVQTLTLTPNAKKRSSLDLPAGAAIAS